MQPGAAVQGTSEGGQQLFETVVRISQLRGESAKGFPQGPPLFQVGVADDPEAVPAASAGREAVEAGCDGGVQTEFVQAAFQPFYIASDPPAETTGNRRRGSFRACEIRGATPALIANVLFAAESRIDLRLREGQGGRVLGINLGRRSSQADPFQLPAILVRFDDRSQAAELPLGLFRILPATAQRS